MIGEATIGISFIFFNFPLGFMLWWLSYSAGFAMLIIWLLKPKTVAWLNELGFSLPSARYYQ